MATKKNKKYSHFLDIQKRDKENKYNALTKTEEFRCFQRDNQKYYEAEHHLIKAFLCSLEGEKVATRLGILPIERAPVELVIPPKEKRHHDLKALEDGKFLTLKIDLSRASRYETLAFIDLMYSWYSPHVNSLRKRNKKATLDMWQVWTLYDVHKNFNKISGELKSNPSTVRKAYYRAFEKVMGIPYNPSEHSLKKLASRSYLPKGYCSTCDKYSKCNTPCPTVIKHINQDTMKDLREQLCEVEKLIDPDQN